MSAWKKHQIFEKNSLILIIGIVIMISIGGLVEIVPLYYLKSTIEKTEGMRPYTPLELVGRNIYVREGCYACHSQQIRPMRDELQRYGNYSLAAESMYDRPFQWGSKRTGPDLARVGGKYSDEWQRDHLVDPRSVSPTSVMPGYPFLMDAKLSTIEIENHLKVNALYGVPYTEEQIASAKVDLMAQAQPDSDAAEGFEERYPGALIRDFDGNAKEVTEMDALVAYLQMLGTLVDFSLYDEKANLR
ncbi:cytochrome c oxidase, cbb3-type, subunit II [Pseudovibrio sp. FO-BEG1]|uniref:Cytochrome-c oxidase, cbb3-type subunit II n=1 Tax=Pseudovibrio brasiliensis TaxID=1898042 RepID=A0ABX8AR42_9HYPH|nr:MULTISPECIES: cytochrome-c oxidase, cbb3-type subunit II [Pseudovibrio]AEV36274.1 cytochrome c oxidase, cbb3-type, subunit II [Pseudovibrio sp. FO-BEG1]EEA94067.1 cytochrome c oxidase, cbb3-type, subunit II [Pseudovibrio sp. JE062]QUS57058.1 cytochrome-c oxidase, cbb3-type subunit II [Pseudovibrio brasiliensis]